MTAMSKIPKPGAPDNRHLSEIEKVDALPKELRDCVHEFGWSVVAAFLDVGVNNPAHIRHLAQAVLLGAREPGNRLTRTNGAQPKALHALDQFLLRIGASHSARALIGLFRQHNMILVQREPTSAMIAAAGCKQQRLRLALITGERQLWPFLYDK